MTRREKRPYAVLGFGSTHDALAAEAALQEAEIPVAVMPAPLALGSQCGIALRLERAALPAAEAALATAGLAATARMEIEDY